MMKKMNKKAFTLIEVIVVVAIIGILVLLAVPRFIGHTQKAELARIQHDVKLMEREMGAEFINKDDYFNEWGNNSKDLNQLTQENKLFEKEGIATEVDPIDGTYKVIPENYEDKINTKLKGTFYANSHGKVYYEHTKPLFGIPTESEKEPGYSDEEIDDLVRHEYIPVATAEELDSISKGEPRIYGEGTKWKGTYEGGLGKHYVQVANIDLSGYSVEGWNPIGTESEIFTGIYDGGNYVIKGLEVKGDGENYQGLFGRTQGATIRNVALENVNVTGALSVGGLVGWALQSTIENSYSTGEVTGSWANIGGLVGNATYDSTIRNSYTTVTVIGSSGVGGLVGGISNTTIDNSHSTGTVTGTREDDWTDVGGLVGGAGSNAVISNSYATGSVTGSSNGLGGLVGSANTIIIENSYAEGSVEGKGHVGGLVGQAQHNIIKNSHATGSVEGSGTYTYVGGLAGSASDSMIENSYATGEVTGTGAGTSTGGLVGMATSSTIENSYAEGAVTGGKYTGGLVGSASPFNDTTTIIDSYATGAVTGNEYKGGLLGHAGAYNGTTTISNSYWNIVTTGQTTSAGEGVGESEGKTTDKMKEANTYSAWDTDVWNIVNGEYPKLR